MCGKNPIQKTQLNILDRPRERHTQITESLAQNWCLIVRCVYRQNQAFIDRTRRHHEDFLRGLNSHTAAMQLRSVRVRSRIEQLTVDPSASGKHRFIAIYVKLKCGVRWQIITCRKERGAVAAGSQQVSLHIWRNNNNRRIAALCSLLSESRAAIGRRAAECGQVNRQVHVCLVVSDTYKLTRWKQSKYECSRCDEIVAELLAVAGYELLKCQLAQQVKSRIIHRCLCLLASCSHSGLSPAPVTSCVLLC